MQLPRFRHCGIRALAIGAALATMIYGLTAPAPAARATQGARVAASGPIRSVAVTGGCLDDYDDNAEIGAVVDLWDCNLQDSQDWAVMTDGSIQIHGLCLATVTGFAGPPGLNDVRAVTNLAYCNGSPDQQWHQTGSGQLINAAIAAAQGSGQGCLDIPPGTPNPGAALQVGRCTPRVTTQQWRIPVHGQGEAAARDVLAGTGDLSLSIDGGGQDPILITQIMNTDLPQAAGVRAGTSVSDTFQAGFSQIQSRLRAAGVDTAGLPTPVSLPGETVSVTGSGGLTLTIPRTDINQVTATQHPEWSMRAIAVTLGTLAGLTAAAICFTLGSVTSPEAVLGLGCSTVAIVVALAVTSFIYYCLRPGQNSHPPTWQSMVTSAFLGGKVNGIDITPMFPWLKEHFAGLLSTVASGLSGLHAANPVLAGIMTDLQPYLGQIGAGFWALYQSYRPGKPGLPSELNGPGQVTSAIPGKCLDNDSGNPGPVILNDCQNPPASPTQYWTLWSNGELTSNGWCLTAPATGAGTPLVTAPCTGGPGQIWAYDSNTMALVDQTSGLCLDDPDAATANGTQQAIYACWQAIQQQWTLPSPPTPAQSS